MEFTKQYQTLYPRQHQALIRDKFKCRNCGREATIVHHIDESRQYGDSPLTEKQINNKLNNLLSLCRPCHAEIHGLRFSHINLPLILELRKNGLTYQAIGKHLGITRQRVHQIISKG